MYVRVCVRCAHACEDRRANVLKYMLDMQVCVLVCKWLLMKVCGVHICVHLDVLRYSSVRVCACLWVLVYTDP